MTARQVTLVVAVVLVIVAGAVGLTFALMYSISPVYLRSAQILDVAWGKDGALYLLVQWVVKEDQRGYYKSVVEFDENAVYRIDPTEKIARRLPMDDARRVIAGWPGRDNVGKRLIERLLERSNMHGWVGGAYRAYTLVQRDTRISEAGNLGVGQPYAIAICLERVVNATTSRTVTNDTVFRWSVDAIKGAIRLSPDDSYLAYQDSASRRTVIRWLPEGREVVAPETAIPAGSDVYPTTHGLLVPGARLLVDPVTWDTRPGWILDPFSSKNLSPGGEREAFVVSNTLVIRASDEWVRIVQRGSTSVSDAYRIEWSIPTERVRFSVPDSWRDQDRYPMRYDLAETAVTVSGSHFPTFAR